MPSENENSSNSPLVKKNRDEFTEKTKLQIAKQAGWHCSYPGCGKLTVGATSDGEGVINIGTAAHICAAAPGGPRYDEKMSLEDRRSARNGIWMCRDHGTVIDSTDPKFTSDLLHDWKRDAARQSWRRIALHEAAAGPVAPETEVATRVHTAAKADLAAHQRRENWPATGVALRLNVESVGEAITTTALSASLASLDDLILIAPPGMGKTTTLYQLTEGLLESGSGTPIVLALGDWATQGRGIVEAILRRGAFQGISEADFRAVAAKPGMVLLLDGWNELDRTARERARVEINDLKAELPKLGLVISTRRQALDVPFSGTPIELLLLNEDQQVEIAKELRGDTGAKLVDQAWRTPGIRELVSIPLYLTALLALPDGAPFPSTKEEVLRLFVAAQETEPRKAEALDGATRGHHKAYLDDLAVLATRMGGTTIPENDARSSITETSRKLHGSGRIDGLPNPSEVLGALVSNHVLTRVTETPGYAFQHHQFLEWYASHWVEHLIMSGIDVPAGRLALKGDILNQRRWEESILFAAERLSRGDAAQQAACGKAILAAFEVDPLLAAEMIFRATDGVWIRVAATIEDAIRRWHTPGQSDRAMRFMLTSGRPEFLEHVWPLLTHENEQVSLGALRNSKRFRVSILGQNPEKHIKALPQRIRLVLLHEVAMNSGIDGMDLAAAIARDDPDPEVKVSVCDALAFRRADRHVAEVLQNADEKAFDFVAQREIFDDVADEYVKRSIAAARDRQMKRGDLAAADRLRAIVYGDKDEDKSAELTKIIVEMEIEGRQDREVHFLYEARKRYPQAVADGLLGRVRADRELFYDADNILAAADYRLEDEALLAIAMDKPEKEFYDRAEAAASVLGPKSVGRMIDALLEAFRQGYVNGRWDPALGSIHSNLRTRIAHAPGASLVTAISERAANAASEEIVQLAVLLSRHPTGENERGRPFDEGSLTTIRRLAEEWGNRLLGSEDAKRRDIAEIASLGRCAPSVTLLPLLKRMLDDNLSRYRGFREAAKAAGWRGPAKDEATHPHMDSYLRTFMATDGPETAVLMREYLSDEHFGPLAAEVLADQWRRENELPRDSQYFPGGTDYTRVEEKRTTLLANPAATSDEAEAIFSAIEPLLVDGATEGQQKRAVALGIVAAQLPHGQRHETIEKLVSVADRRSRAALLMKLALSGHVIDIETVKAGLADVINAAESQSWILYEGYEVQAWLRLVPFTNDPEQAVGIVKGLPDGHRKAGNMEDMFAGLGHAPGEKAEKALFALAETYPTLYKKYDWQSAVLKRRTRSANRRYVELAAEDAFDGSGSNGWRTTREIASMLGEDDELRAYAYGLIKNGVSGKPGLQMVAQAIAENPDEVGLLLLLQCSPDLRRSLINPRTIEGVVTEHVLDENWKGAYGIVPVAVPELRRKLLSMTTDGSQNDIPARILNWIDRTRDAYGAHSDEPRHPNLASGKSWPILTPDPDATAD